MNRRDIIYLASVTDVTRYLNFATDKNTQPNSIKSERELKSKYLAFCN